MVFKRTLLFCTSINHQEKVWTWKWQCFLAENYAGELQQKLTLKTAEETHKLNGGVTEWQVKFGVDICKVKKMIDREKKPLKTLAIHEAGLGVIIATVDSFSENLNSVHRDSHSEKKNVRNHWEKKWDKCWQQQWATSWARSSSAHSSSSSTIKNIQLHKCRNRKAWEKTTREETQ